MGYFNFFSAWISSVRSSCYPLSLIILYLCMIIFWCAYVWWVWRSWMITEGVGSLLPLCMFSGLNSWHQAWQQAACWLSHPSGLCPVSFLIDPSQFQWAPNIFWAVVSPSSQHLPPLHPHPTIFNGKNPYVTEDCLILLILLPLPPAYWGYSHAPPWPI